MSRIVPPSTAATCTDDSANKRAGSAVDIVQPVTVRNSRILTLLLVLEAMRDPPAVRDQ